jgi:hypothetical protein
MPLEFADDARHHDVTEAEDWRESYYCNFADPTSGLHGVAWQGVRPNMERGEAVFVLYDGDRPLIHSVDMGVPVDRTVGAERVHIGNQRFECVDPWRRWNVHFDDGTSSATVEWTQLTETCDWDWEDLTGGSKHFQAAGTVQVRARVAGRELEFSGYGERDRAWGPRNYDPIEFSWWVVAHFPDDVTAHGFVQLVGGEYRLMGFLHAAGRTRPLAQFTAEDAVYEPQNGPAASATMRFIDDEGRQISLLSQRVHYLSFGTSEGGAELEERDPGDQATGRMYLTFQQFTRTDGVQGRGMIDNNLRVGTAPASFAAGEPNHSTLYDYGMAVQVPR